MAPIVRSLPSYVKDSQHALQIFRDFNFLGEYKLIFTMDITSLCIVIPNGEVLLALKHFFDLRTVKEPSSETYTSYKLQTHNSQSYLLYSSSHPSHVKNSIPYSQFLTLRRLCSKDSDFSLKSEEMCAFFDNRGYPASVVQEGHHRAQQIDRQSTLQTSQKENRIPFTLTFHPHYHAVKSIILKNFKLLQNDPDTGRIFSQPPLISFKRDKNIGNFLVRGGFQRENNSVLLTVHEHDAKHVL